MIIALDVDGVLRDFNASLERVYRKYNPTHDPIPEAMEWDLQPSYAQCEDINEFAFNEHAFEIFNNAEPYPGAVHFVNCLHAKGHLVAITSFQFPAMRPVLLAWLDRYKIEYHALMFTPMKALVDADVLIDDAPSFLMNWVSATGKPAIQVLRSWNVNMQESEKYIRCMTYTDIMLALYEIQDRKDKA